MRKRKWSSIRGRWPARWRSCGSIRKRKRVSCVPPTARLRLYNVQTAVDAEHALIVAEQVTDQATDNRSLQPMAEAAQAAVGEPTMNVVADAGYSNGEQAEACEAKGIVPHVPANRAVNNQGNGKLFDRSQFQYDEKTDTFRCP